MALPTPLLEEAALEPNLLAAFAIRLATEPAARLAFAGAAALEFLRAAGFAAALRATFTLVVVAFLAVVFLAAAFLQQQGIGRFQARNRSGPPGTGTHPVVAW